MYAIVQVGSLQYKVSQGDIIEVQRLNDEEGKSITLDKVLLCADGQTVKIGQPYLKDTKIAAKITRHHLDDKVVAFKYKRRKNFAWKKGHRQRLTALEITKITAGK